MQCWGLTRSNTFQSCQEIVSNLTRARWFQMRTSHGIHLYESGGNEGFCLVGRLGGDGTPHGFTRKAAEMRRISFERQLIYHPSHKRAHPRVHNVRLGWETTRLYTQNPVRLLPIQPNVVQSPKIPLVCSNISTNLRNGLKEYRKNTGKDQQFTHAHLR